MKLKVTYKCSHLCGRARVINLINKEPEEMPNTMGDCDCGQGLMIRLE